MEMTKSYSVSPKLAKLVFGLILLAVVGFGVYTFVVKAAAVVTNAYVPSDFK